MSIFGIQPHDRFGRTKPTLSYWACARCAANFWARLAHYIIYTMGVPVLRTLTFVAGFAAQLVLVLAIFRVV